MEKIQKSFDVGVIVGRFQVDELTDGHKKLIGAVQKEHKRVIIFLGLSPCKCTFNNPLDFQARKIMLQEAYPDIEIYYIHDIGSDVIWSDDLDGKIIERVYTDESVCLYGSRDSFIQYYSGKFDTCELEQEVFVSGTEVRKRLVKQAKRNADFRAGVICSTFDSWPSVLPTVDIAILNESGTKILLGKKEHETFYRFIGGFGEPGEDFETTAVREVKEEANIDVDSLEYIKSFVINDWRYKNEVNKITTILYKTTLKTGTPSPGDDIHSLRWFPFNKFTITSIISEHKEMLTYLLEHK